MHQQGQLVHFTNHIPIVHITLHVDKIQENLNKMEKGGIIFPQSKKDLNIKKVWEGVILESLGDGKLGYRDFYLELIQILIRFTKNVSTDICRK